MKQLLSAGNKKDKNGKQKLNEPDTHSISSHEQHTIDLVDYNKKNARIHSA